MVWSHCICSGALMSASNCGGWVGKGWGGEGEERDGGEEGFHWGYP